MGTFLVKLMTMVDPFAIADPALFQMLLIQLGANFFYDSLYLYNYVVLTNQKCHVQNVVGKFVDK